MKIGIAIAFNGAHTPDQIIAMSQAIEEFGFHSMWVPEHVVFFGDYNSKYPYTDTGRIPGDPDGVIDPFSVLTFIASHTKTLRLGTGICLVPQRSPLYCARVVSDVDYLSNGRFDFGIGVGWQKEEFEALNLPFERRGDRTRECLAAMQALWSGSGTFKGEFYSFENCLQTPGPVQQPHPPFIFGGESEAALRRVADIGQGWYGYNLTPETAAERLGRLRELVEANGRSMDDIQIHIGAQPSAQNSEAMQQFAALGVDQVIVGSGARTAEKLKERLQRPAQLLNAA